MVYRRKSKRVFNKRVKRSTKRYSKFKKNVGKYPTRRIVPRMTGALCVETKYRDFGADAFLIPHVLNATAIVAFLDAAATTTKVLNTCAQGTGVDNRDGNRICLKSLEVNFSIRSLARGFNTTSSLDDTMAIVQSGAVKVFVFMDLAHNAGDGSLNTGLVYKDYLAHSPLSFRNLEETNRFKVLKSKIYNFNNGDTVSQGTVNSLASWVSLPKIMSKRMHIKLKGLQTSYKGSTKAPTDIVDNALYIAVVCEPNAGQLYFDCNARTKWIG